MKDTCNIGSMKVKGKVKIEIFDKDTKELLRTVSRENFFGEMPKAVASSLSFVPFASFLRGDNIDNYVDDLENGFGIGSNFPDFFKQLYLLNRSTPIVDASSFLNGDLIGYATQDAYVGSDIQRGSIDTATSGWNRETNELALKFNFLPAVANGTINVAGFGYNGLQPLFAINGSAEHYSTERVAYTESLGHSSVYSNNKIAIPGALFDLATKTLTADTVLTSATYMVKSDFHGFLYSGIPTFSNGPIFTKTAQEIGIFDENFNLLEYPTSPEGTGLFMNSADGGETCYMTSFSGNDLIITPKAINGTNGKITTNGTVVTITDFYVDLPETDYKSYQNGNDDGKLLYYERNALKRIYELDIPQLYIDGALGAANTYEVDPCTLGSLPEWNGEYWNHYTPKLAKTMNDTNKTITSEFISSLVKSDTTARENVIIGNLGTGLNIDPPVVKAATNLMTVTYTLAFEPYWPTA